MATLSRGIQEPEPDFEEPMTTDAMKVRQDICAFYAIPEECLLSRVPPILQAVDDHVLFPFSPEWPARRWVRLSSFEAFKKVCFKFRKILVNKTIMIFVMPYLSLEDAYEIHQLVKNPGRIRLLNDATNCDGEESQALPVQGRSGVLTIYDLHALVDESHTMELDFTVVNYGLLWAKASDHLDFIGSSHQANELIGQIEHHKHRIMEDSVTENAVMSADYMASLEEKIEQVKVDLLLSLHRNDIDPHNAVLAMDAALHEELYDLGYDPCYPNSQISHEMVETTNTAIEAYMLQLENSEHGVYDVKQARWNVLEAEGSYEAEAHRLDAIKQFYQALQTCNDQLVDAMNKIKIFDSRPSLIGVRSWSSM